MFRRQVLGAARFGTYNRTRVSHERMDLAMNDFATARQKMVDGQITPNGVTNRSLIAAMRALPREAYLPVERAALAYADEDVPLGNGRYMTEPMVIARLAQLAAPVAGERALVVGANTGYGAALLTTCGMQVTALESCPKLAALARRALPDSVPVVEGPLKDGWLANAPYDLILIEGAVAEIPDSLFAQLKHNGRAVVMMAEQGARGQGVLVQRDGDVKTVTSAFEAATPRLPEFESRPEFAF